MKIVCISDQHGYLPDNIPDGDVLVIAGDICPVQNHNIGHQKWWLKNRFNLWLNNLPFDKDHVVAIAGNHDLIFMDEPKLVPNLACHYLQDSGVTVDGIKFYGHPHTPIFNNWAFNQTPEYLEKVDAKIPDDTDVLLTHGPPYGILDSVTDDSYNLDNKYLGCKKLKKRLNNMPNLKLNVFGHIHSGHGIVKPTALSKIKTTYVNASLINERYEPDYDIIVVDL